MVPIFPAASNADRRFVYRSKRQGLFVSITENQHKSTKTATLRFGIFYEILSKYHFQLCSRSKRESICCTHGVPTGNCHMRWKCHMRWNGHMRCATWLIHVCAMAHSYAWHDAFIRVTWRIHTRDMTHSYVWHDAFIRVAWHIHTCDMTHSYVWHYSFMCVKRLIHMYDMTQSYVCRKKSALQLILIHMFVACIIHMCDMTHAHVLYRHILMRGMSVWHNSRMRVSKVSTTVNNYTARFRKDYTPNARRNSQKSARYSKYHISSDWLQKFTFGEILQNKVAIWRSTACFRKNDIHTRNARRNANRNPGVFRSSSTKIPNGRKISVRIWPRGTEKFKSDQISIRICTARYEEFEFCDFD